MADYTTKSKFKALRNIGCSVAEGQIGAYMRETSYSADEFIVDFAGSSWVFYKDTLDTAKYSDEPAIKYIGDIE